VLRKARELAEANLKETARRHGKSVDAIGEPIVSNYHTVNVHGKVGSSVWTGWAWTDASGSGTFGPDVDVNKCA
jgi:hypothetical protein